VQELVLAFGWLAPSVAKEALGISALKQLLDALLGVELFRIQILKKQVCELEFVVDRSIGHDPSLDAGGFESVSVLLVGGLFGEPGEFLCSAEHQCGVVAPFGLLDRTIELDVIPVETIRGLEILLRPCVDLFGFFE